MSKPTILIVAVIGLLTMLSACAPSGDGGETTEPAETAEATAEPAEEPAPPSLVGEVTREEIEQAEPEWMTAMAEAEIDPEAAQGLAAVEPGAEVMVYFGTWCGDSRRELARFWRALDETGGMVPFEINYLAVDRRDKRPPELETEVGLQYVPTFVVSREGEEVGRMVEVSPNGIETDLLALLAGEATGVVSARDDLGGGEEAGEEAGQ